MIRLKSMRPTVAVLLAAVLIVAAGGAAVASNMGFKFNKPLVLVPTGVVTQTGNNWTSVPYNNPYGTLGGFCTQTGLVSSGLTRTTLTTKNYNTNNEGFKTYSCGSAGATAQAILKGKMFQIRQPTVAGATNSIIIVGSHDPAHPFVIDKLLDYWLSVPYHTTWVTTNDLCTQAGLTSTGLTRATIARLNPGPPAAFQTVACGSASPFNLVLGEGVQAREPVKTQVSFVPAHY